MIDKFEYIKCYWKYIDDETLIILFYEVNLGNERYATRMAEVFVDRKVTPIAEAGFEFITEAPVPIIGEINKEEFEEVYHFYVYSGDMRLSK